MLGSINRLSLPHQRGEIDRQRTLDAACLAVKAHIYEWILTQEEHGEMIFRTPDRGVATPRVIDGTLPHTCLTAKAEKQIPKVALQDVAPAVVEQDYVYRSVKVTKVVRQVIYPIALSRLRLEIQEHAFCSENAHAPGLKEGVLSAPHDLLLAHDEHYLSRSFQAFRYVGAMLDEEG